MQLQGIQTRKIKLFVVILHLGQCIFMQKKSFREYTSYSVEKKDLVESKLSKIWLCAPAVEIPVVQHDSNRPVDQGK